MRKHQKACLDCGEKYVSKRSDAKYCSNACRQNSYLIYKYGLYNNQQKRESPKKTTGQLLLLSNEILFLFAKGSISKNDVEKLITKSKSLNFSFTSLPEHNQVLKMITTICQALLEVLNATKEDNINLLTPKSRLINHLESIMSQSKTAFSFVFPN